MALGVLGVLSASVPVDAQTRIGVSTAVVLGNEFRAVSAAYDPVNDVHLSIAGGNQLYARFTRQTGTATVPVSATFLLYDGSAGYGHFNRAVWNPETGQFVVVYQDGIAERYGVLRSRVISFTAPGYLVGSQQTLSDAGLIEGTRVESQPAIAYSTVAHRYLAAWITPSFGLRARLLDMNGVPIGLPIVVENSGSHSLSLAAHPTTNYFGLANTAWSGNSAFAAFRLIDGAGTVGPRSSFGFTAGTYATGVDVNSAGQYVMSWGLQPGTYSALFNASGTLISGPTFVSGSIGGDLSLGIAYNRTSNTILAVSSAWFTPDSLEVAGLEMSATGAPITTAHVLTDGATGGSFYPFPIERVGSNQWNIVYTKGKPLQGAILQVVQTSGATAPTPSPTPTPTPTPSPTGCSTADPFAAIGGGTCVNGGWIPGGGGSGGGSSSGGCSTPNPFASLGTGTCVNGAWVMSGSSSGGSGGGSSSGCATADPFAAIGGGTCVNGGWIPGGSGASSGGSSGCSTPNPFASLGTGTCVNGGWVMSGSTSGGAGGGSSSGCATPNPFASLGTGTCVNGGWVPTGSSSSSGGSSSGCSTPNPFASLGTGTCVNGGWIMSGSSSGGSSSGCTGADPFAGIGGGVCVAGGWVPASSSSSSTCSTPNPFVSLGVGTCVNGGWVPR